MSFSKGLTPTSAVPASHRDWSSLSAQNGGIVAAVTPLRKVWGIVRKRKWIVVGVIAAALLIGLLITFLTTPMYTASATIEIRREGRNFTHVDGAEAGEGSRVDQEFYQTQYGLLTARSLAEQVAGDLKLSEDPAFFEAFGSKRARQWFSGRRLLASAPKRSDRMREAADILLDHVKISAARLSSLVEIDFTSPDPALSKRVVDAWGTSFIASTLQRRYGTTAYARKFLEGRLAQLQKRINESERQQVDYAAREQIINLPGSPGGNGAAATPERSLASDDLSALNGELAKAIAARVAAESRLGGSNGVAPEAVDNAAVGQLRARRAELASDYAKLTQQFDPKYPAALALRRQMDQIDIAIGREETRVGGSLLETYRSAQQREQILKAQVDRLKSQSLDFRRRSIQYNIIGREVETSRQLYDALLQRYKEIGIAGSVGVSNISVVDTSELPTFPSSPRLLVNLIVSLVAGVLLAAVVLFVLEQIDEGINDPAEALQELGQPLLGTIPKLSGGRPVDAMQDVKGPLVEAYFSLASSLGFATDHGFPRMLLVTSSRPAEGKSLTSYALAKSLVRMNKRVILIDADLRSPSVHHMVGIQGARGVSNFLRGENDLATLIHEVPEQSLAVMAAGPQPPSAVELLSSDRFELLLAELGKTFDHVIIDGPPVMGLADAPVIASKVEASIFVIEAHGTRKGVARVAIGRMLAARANLIGVILTKFDTQQAHYGYGHDYGYEYGYGTKPRAQPVA